MRYIIVGYGNIGHKRQAVLGKKCVATVDPNPNSKADFLDYKKIPLGIFDTAVLTVPQQYKFEQTKYFLENNKNVLVEKPLLLTKNQAEKLKRISSKNKVIWYTSYNHRFEPNIIKMQMIIKSGLLGKLYHGKFVYSFGNIKERIGTWRETEYGVLEEIAPHDLDLIMKWFHYKGGDFELIFARKVESKIFDHWLYKTYDNKFTVENSAVNWKNIFSIDIYFELGSIHLDGLNKWGQSKLITSKRIFPAGIPKEKIIETSGKDETWNKDFNFFEELVKNNLSSYGSDLQTSLAVANISLAATPYTKNDQRRLYEEIKKGN